jgi:hypothetical protein
MLIISAIFLKMAKRTRYKRFVRHLYSGEESLSNLSTLWYAHSHTPRDFVLTSASDYCVVQIWIR